VANGRPVRIATFRHESYSNIVPDLAASSSRIGLALGFLTNDRFGHLTSGAVRTAPVGGDFESLEEDCTASSRVVRNFDVSGHAVVYHRCHEQGAYPVVRDYGGPVPIEQQIPARPAGGLRIAGRYVAALEDSADEGYNVSSIAVWDRFTGALVYRVPKEASEAGIHSLALQDDGRIAFSFSDIGDGPGSQVAWASPGEPYSHVLPLPRRAKYELQLVGDRIGYIANRSSVNGAIAGGEVGISDLAGNRRRIARWAEGSAFNENFDFDGERIAWLTYSCRALRLHIAAVDTPPPDMGPRAGCPLRFDVRPRVLANGRVRLFVDCTGFSGGHCQGRQISISVRRDGRRLVVARGERERTVNLTPAGQKIVTRRSRVRVRVGAVIVDDSGRRERRAASTVLRR
jgi:hypothetical protein